MKDKIETTLEYYQTKERQILDAVNSNSKLTTEDIIHYGEEMAIIVYKITALEIAKEN
ncbi:hypothetical protein [Psychroserpens algicola]|uniref:Phage protein n=1 Tax=Psychroserpens algicola TaxID=1719034 RepID=A0ABT0H3Z2_9FLAO|nr:hypothetical protein [Psychroserpens algicola]MCK8479098.1 hypothetical protein [Psychroserpens algicola]